MSDLRDQLQTALSGSYVIERELGGGGMSRVFVARETALGRNVVVKVLPPELMEGVSVDRFKREIQMAAQLQHPHIVGVLSAGEIGGLPFYTMPFVDGMSLRARLSASGALPMTEVISILRDVAKALGYAHEHGVVHRDIKPDNVLLSGGSAVVADFGIAKAIAAARAQAHATLTSVGSAMGTPAYMAPEQAAADPAIDHRADIYAFGVMAYEMLTGKPPFSGMTPQRLLAAQMSEIPKPIGEIRLDTPADLAELVMRCLEKDADKRPQRANDLVKVLEAVTSGGSHSAMPAILLAGRPRLGRALTIWAGATASVAIVSRAAIIAIGLPDWVFPAALIVMGLGLPAILFTYFVHRGAERALTMRPTTPGGSSTSMSTLSRIAVQASPHVTWRRTTLGGVVAIVLLILAVGGYMTLRALGIGPAGSLIGSGAIRANERLIVADFATRGADSSLGPVVTEAFRAGLGQSSRLSVMPANAVREVLRRMQRPLTTPVDFALAREIATREGMKAVVDGSVLAVGGSFTISARLVSSQTGETLASFQESAKDDHEILPAIDRLTGKMRERIGESLKDIREARALEQVTTPSLDALRKFVQATRALSFEGDFNKGQALLEEALALDTGFAMAYRRLAVELNNRGTQPVRVMQLLEKAYQHRDRLSDAERYLAEAAYFASGPHQNMSKAISAYESLIDLQPENATPLNNVSVQYQETRDLAKAQDAITRAEKTPLPPAVVFANLGFIGAFRNDTAQVRRGIREMRARYPTNAFGAVATSRLIYFLSGPDSARAALLASRRLHSSDATSLANDAEVLADLAQMQGRASEAHRWLAEDGALLKQVGSPGARLESGVNLAWLAAWVQGDAALAAQVLDQTLAAEPVASVPHAARPYRNLTSLFALLGRVDKAKALVALLDRERQAVTRSEDERVRHTMLGDIALAERRYGDAQKEYREADQGPCLVCPLPKLASAYDLGGNADSSIAIFTRYLETPDPFRLRGAGGVDGDYLAFSYRRLGELWEAKGDKQKAAGYYLKFVELWKNADPELQPIVAEVRKRLARLKDTEGK